MSLRGKGWGWGPDAPEWPPELASFKRMIDDLIESGWRPICYVEEAAAFERIEILCLYGVVRGWRDPASNCWAKYGPEGHTWPVHGFLFRRIRN